MADSSVKKNVLTIAAGVIVGFVGLYLLAMVFVVGVGSMPLGSNQKDADQVDQQIKLLKQAHSQAQTDSLVSSFKNK